MSTRRTVLKTPMIAAGMLALPKLAQASVDMVDWPWVEGELAMVDTLGQGIKPGVCVEADGDCGVGIMLLDGTMCYAHQPCRDFRPITDAERGRAHHQWDLLTKGIVTLIQDGKPFAKYRLYKLPQPITPTVVLARMKHLEVCENIMMVKSGNASRMRLTRSTKNLV